MNNEPSTWSSVNTESSGLVPTAPAEPALARPVEESARLTAIDATRGLALLGIFCVNVQSFGEPFGFFKELSAELQNDRGAWLRGCHFTQSGASRCVRPGQASR